MSKKLKVLISVVVAVAMLTVGSVATVMAQEETTATPQTNSLFSRVAEILDIPQENLADASQQARQEMKQEACEENCEQVRQQLRQARQEMRQEFAVLAPKGEVALVLPHAGN